MVKSDKDRQSKIRGSKVYVHVVQVIAGTIEVVSRSSDEDKGLDGIHLEKYKSGARYGRYRVKKGKVVGTVKRWYKDGQQEYESKCIPGARSRRHTYWYSNGKKEVRYITNCRGITGIHTGWYPTGIRASVRSFKNGKLHGRWVTWFPDGTMQHKWYYKQDEKHGKQTT